MNLWFIIVHVVSSTQFSIFSENNFTLDCFLRLLSQSKHELSHTQGMPHVQFFQSKTYIFKHGFTPLFLWLLWLKHSFTHDFETKLKLVLYKILRDFDLKVLRMNENSIFFKSIIIYIFLRVRYILY